MKKILYSGLLLVLCFSVQGQRITLDSSQHFSRKKTTVASSQPSAYRQSVCEVAQNCNANCVYEGEYPQRICCNKNRVKNEFFKYGPYVYPYIYNQPGFYFGPGIPKIHYW